MEGRNYSLARSLPCRRRRRRSPSPEQTQSFIQSTEYRRGVESLYHHLSGPSRLLSVGYVPSIAGESTPAVSIRNGKKVIRITIEILRLCSIYTPLLDSAYVLLLHYVGDGWRLSQLSS